MPQEALTISLGLAVVDAGGKLVRGETAEDHRMHGAEPRGGEHCQGGFRNHRHVDEDAVALFDALVAARAGSASTSPACHWHR
jgi:hypothetical protein